MNIAKTGIIQTTLTRGEDNHPRALLLIITFVLLLFAGLSYCLQFHPAIAYANVITIALLGFFLLKPNHILPYLAFNSTLLLLLLFICPNSLVDKFSFSIVTLVSSGVFSMVLFNRVNTINKLKEQQEVMNAAFYESTDAFILYDVKHKKIERANKKVIRLLSFNSETQFVRDATSRTKLFSFIHQQLVAIKGNLKMADAWKHEIKLETLDHRSILVDMAISAIQNTDLLLIRLTDVTHEKLSQHALDMMRASLAQVSEMLFWTDPNGNIVYTNAAASNTLGYKRNTLINTKMERIAKVNTNNEQLYTPAFFKQLKAVRTITEETEFTSKNGITIPVELSHTYVNFKEREFVCTFGRDISERKEVFKKVKQSEQKWRSIFENGPLGMVLVGNDQEILKANEYFCNMLGYTKEELKNLNVAEITHPDDITSTKLLSQLKLAGSKSKTIKRVEKRYLAKNGSIVWGAVTATFLNGESGEIKYSLGMIENITERKNAQKDLELYAERLQASNTELEQFAYVVSHDLQEPLRMVSNYLQLLERRYKEQLDKDAEEFIHFAVDGSKRMHGLIQDLLEYSRVNTRGKAFELTDTNDSLRKTLHNLQTKVEETKAKITFDKLPILKADGIQLTQLFQNLIGNSIKYCETKPPTIHITAKELETAWQISVIDNGIGIDEEYHDKVFGVFKRLHARGEYQGNGIGLAIGKRIVNRHGGKIWLDSTQKEGLTVHFTIPKH